MNTRLTTSESAERQAEEPDVEPSGESISEPVVKPSPPLTRKFRGGLIIFGGVLVVCAVAYWQIRIIHGLFNGLVPYAPVVLPSLIAFGAIVFKDWKSYKPHWVRWVLIVLVVSAGGMGIAYQYSQRQDKAEASRLSQKNIDDLKGQAKAAQQAQTENTKQFLESLGRLSDKVSDLQTRAATEELKAQLATVKGELERTRQALDPPKSELAFSFVPFTNPAVGQSAVPNTEVTLPIQADGSVHVEFSVLNLTDVAAIDGELTLQICDQCRFAKEPADFRKLAGQNERQRFMSFDRILARVALHDIAADVIAPPYIENFPVAIVYRCKNCVVHADDIRGVVHIRR